MATRAFLAGDLVGYILFAKDKYPADFVFKRMVDARLATTFPLVFSRQKGDEHIREAVAELRKVRRGELTQYGTVAALARVGVLLGKTHAMAGNMAHGLLRRAFQRTLEALEDGREDAGA